MHWFSPTTLLGLARKSLFLMSELRKYTVYALLSAESRSPVDVAAVGRFLAHALCTETCTWECTQHTHYSGHAEMCKNWTKRHSETDVGLPRRWVVLFFIRKWDEAPGESPQAELGFSKSISLQDLVFPSTGLISYRSSLRWEWT